MFRNKVKRALVQIEKQKEQRMFEMEFAIKKEIQEQFIQNCRPAAANDYADWLKGYLNKGGEITHPYNYPLTRNGVTATKTGLMPAKTSWYVLEKPAMPPSLYGALSLNVIVPNNLYLSPSALPNTFHGRCGHNSFFFMKNFMHSSSIVPIYTDVANIILSETQTSTLKVISTRMREIGS